MNRYAFALLAAVATPALAQTPPSEARAEARAEGNQTVTHRVEVVNGKVVVDEKTVNGKVVPGGRRGKPGGMPPGASAEEMLKRLREKMGLPLSGKLPAGTSSSSSHCRRVVVENGKTVVDEETRDGKPVSRSGDAHPPSRRDGTPGLGLSRAKELKRRSAEKDAKNAAKTPAKRPR